MKSTLTLEKDLLPQETYLSELLEQNSLDYKPHEPLELVLEIQKGTSVTIIDDLHSHLFFNTKIEFLVEQDATVSYEVKLLEGIDTIFGKKSQNSIADTTTISKELNVHLVGARARAFIKGSCIGHEKRIFKFKTLQNHQAPHATSDVVIKGVLADEAIFSCNSMIRVAQEAQGTHAEQANKNILLSDKARATSIPMLEVIANDVTCKHGAAVSPFNEEHLFYLESRGLKPSLAKRILVEGFLG